jgi:hypothetical protein
MRDEREDVARKLREVKDEVRRKALLASEPTGSLPPPQAVRKPQAVPREVPAVPGPPPAAPDAARVNESWRTEPRTPRGLKGLLVRLHDRLLRPRFEAQQAFNARQVQLDNEILRYLEKRFAITHRHYDQVLGIHGRRLEEIDERHMIIQEELVMHVEDLVQRIDLVLAGAERGRLSLEHEMRDVRGRLERLLDSLDRSPR